MRLGELELAEDVNWLQRELKQLDEFKDLSRPLASAEQMRANAFEHLRRYLFARNSIYPLTGDAFAAGLKQARERLRGLSIAFVDLVEDLLQAYQDIRLHTQPYVGMEADLERLMPSDFLLSTPYEQLPHVRRYLRAMLIRAERARSGPGKDARKGASIRPFQEALDRYVDRESSQASSTSRHREVEQFRWMVEEFRVSTFAQELGTAYPISVQRLEQQMDRIAAAA